MRLRIACWDVDPSKPFILDMKEKAVVSLSKINVKEQCSYTLTWQKGFRASLAQVCRLDGIFFAN